MGTSDTTEGMKNPLSKISLLLLLICLSTSAWSQKSKSNVTDTIPAKKKFDWNKVYAGGNIGLLFGSVTIIDIYPIIGYRLTKKTSVGVGITYQYFRDNRYGFSTNIYGGSVFARHVIAENIFAHSEYELLSREFFLIDRVTGTIVDDGRRNVGSLLVGGGYRQRIGGNSFFVLMVLWNLNESVYSLYPNPIIRMGVNIGL